MLEAITYTARISYKVDGGTCIYKREYFGDVESATRWAFEHVTEIALHWGGRLTLMGCIFLQPSKLATVRSPTYMRLSADFND